MLYSKLILLVLLIFGIGNVQAEKKTSNIYVSTLGSDKFDGSEKKPFKTLERAKNEIQNFKKAGNTNDFKVIISGGKYFITEPISFGKEDGGSESSVIVYEGRSDEDVRFLGGIELFPSKFKPLKLNDSMFKYIPESSRSFIVVYDLKKTGLDDLGKIQSRGMGISKVASPVELCVNNQYQNLARWPNEGYVRSGKAIDKQSFMYRSEDPDRWVDEKDAWGLGYWRVGWADLSTAFDKVDTINNVIHLKEIKSGYGRPKDNIKWCAFNLISELDVPGEYYIDRESERLYYYPVSDLDSCEIFLSTFGDKLNSMIEIVGAKNLKFSNISFQLSRYGALSIVNGENIVINHCKFGNTGNSAIRINGQNIQILNSEIFDCGAEGIFVNAGDRNKLESGNVLIENCKIRHFGVWNRTYAPGIKIAGVGTIVRKCKITDAPHSAILFGGNNHLIELNEIANVCYETDDAGAIYTGRDWALHGTIIKNNYIHQIKSIRNPNEKNAHQYGVHAIYLDDCASGLTVFGNVFNDISGRAVMCGGGRDNKIRNNIIVNCGSAHFTDRRGLKQVNEKPGDSWNLRGKIEKLNYTKPPFSSSFPTLAKIMDDGYEMAKEPQGCEIINNIGYHNKRWLEENCNGKCGGFDFYYIEGNLENEDPMFKDENDLLKGLSKGSPVFKINGFQPIPFDKIGLKK